MNGMENKQPLLSICIPTYNGGEKLKLTIIAALRAIHNYSDIEIIVSDNCSTDNTSDILMEFSSCSQMRFYRNNKNLGFNNNMLLLVRQYAKGKYCWVIGDDDFIDEDALYFIREALVCSKLEYLSVSHRTKTLSEYQNFHLTDRKASYIVCSFAQAIELNACSGNILGTFMSSSIFVREKIQSFDFSIFQENSWANYYSTFPNAYLMAVSFRNSVCGCITTPLLTALVHEKDWDDKNNLMIFNYLPSLYNDFRKRLGDKLICNKEIIRQNRLYRICFLIKKKRMREIPIAVFIQSLFWSSTYKLLLHKLI